MAVLKDLIVHGPSRFINTAQFESLNTNKIGAEEGIFNKIVATTGDIGSLTVEDLTAGKATVLSLLDVRGELHTNQWTNSNIATIDGSFYITPTIGIPEGTMTTTANSLSVYGTNFPISSVYVNGINSDNTARTVAWTTGSKVLITGEILVNGTYMPLGTLVGTLGTNVTASRIDINSITDNRYQTAASLAEIGTQSTALPCRNVKVSLYQTSRSSTLYPLGIFMTALGENGKTFLDIYGGGYATSTATAGGFARPVLRIGNLAGLPNVGEKTPVGYGIYTSNGYFSGTIVSTSGKIANFTIKGSKMYSNNHSAYNTATNGIYIGDDYISFGNGGVTYFNTSGTGKIGPWILTANEIYNGKAGGIGATTTTAGVYLGINGLNISNGTADTTSYITKTEVNIGNKLTWKDKVLTVNGSIIANYLRIESEAEIVDVDGVISNEVVSNELEDSINGLFYYQYTVTSGGKTTVYNVSYDEERSGSPYFYIDENGNEHTVTEADLDREDGELIYHRVGGITGQLENVNQNIQITNANISAINERIDSVDNTANTNQATLGTLITDVNSINTTVSDVQADIQEVEDNISSLKSVVEILDDRIIIHSGDSSIELTDKQITLMGNESGSVATITSDAINIAKTNIIEQYTGNLKWTGRTDGHLTLQRIN